MFINFYKTVIWLVRLVGMTIPFLKLAGQQRQRRRRYQPALNYSPRRNLPKQVRRRIHGKTSRVRLGGCSKARKCRKSFELSLLRSAFTDRRNDDSVQRSRGPSQVHRQRASIFPATFYTECAVLFASTFAYLRGIHFKFQFTC